MEQIAPDHEHIMNVIYSILLFFGIAGVIVPFLQRLKISSVLAYLLCGIAVGPFGLALLSDDYPFLSYISVKDFTTVQTLGELGIIALLFMIGLELSFNRLKELRTYIFGLGSAQIIITAFVIFAIALVFGNSVQASVLLGASLALSSTAIVMKLLEEKKLSSKPIGILCFSVLIMQDLAVIPILVLASSFSGNEDTGVIEALGTSLVLGACAVIVIYWLGKRVLSPLLNSLSVTNNPEWLAAFVVFVVIGCAALTDIAGLSLALGAFMAGLLISETEFKHEVEIIVSPIKGMLLGIFFLSVGMMVNLAEIINFPFRVSVSVLGIYTIKATIIFLICMSFKLPSKQSASAAIYLAQPGEFALMILGVAMATNLMPAHDLQFFLLVTVVAMMVTPFLFKLAPLAGNIAHNIFRKKEMEEPGLSIIGNKQCVIIAGFGSVGQVIGKTLDEQSVPYVAFDLSAKCVNKFKKQNVNIIYGDARKKELWHMLVDENVEAAVIAIDEHNVAKNILESLRAQFPLLPVIVRTKDIDDSHSLYDEGASQVVSETFESGLRIVELLLEQLKEDPEEAKHVIEKARCL